MSLIDSIPLNEFKRSVERALELTAKRIGGEINHEFTLAIMDFYRAYKPKRGRTSSMFQFAKGAGGKGVFYKSNGEDAYIAGIEVDPSNYDGNPYKKNHGWKDVTPSWVFDISYLNGIHGFTSDMVSGHNETTDITKKRKWNPKTIPPKTTPPDQIMESAFDRKFTEGYVQSVLDSYLK